MLQKVLGIDVASSSWNANGSAVVEFDTLTSRIVSVVAGAIPWPAKPLTAPALAQEIDDFVRREGVAAVALDGPQGWRDPQTAQGTPGVGRRCEYECRTQGKTGVYPVTYPQTQRAWIEFSVHLFDELLGKEGVALANSPSPLSINADYLVAECFPTSTWRTSGLQPLPGKGRRPVLAPHLASLSLAYSLPSFTTSSHDDLQAVVAALIAVGVVGGPVLAMARGVPAVTTNDRRLEGLIWDAQPSAESQAQRTPSSSSKPLSLPTCAVYVTAKVLEQVNRTSDWKQGQVTFTGIDGATASTRRSVTFKVENENYTLVVGDSHAFWPSHQEGDAAEQFERLFGMLADRPDERILAEVISPET